MCSKSNDEQLYFTPSTNMHKYETLYLLQSHGTKQFNISSGRVGPVIECSTADREVESYTGLTA